MRKCGLIFLFFLFIIIFSTSIFADSGIIVCTPESTDPLCMKIKSEMSVYQLQQSVAPGCTKKWKKTIILNCYYGESRYKECSLYRDTASKCWNGVTTTFICDYDLCELKMYKLESDYWYSNPKLVYTKYYTKGDKISKTSKIHCNSETDWYIDTYRFDEYEISGTPSCPTGNIKRVYVDCINKQKVYDVYKITYTPSSCTEKPYCIKSEEFQRKDYEDVECCVSQDCPRIDIPNGYKEGICSNFKCEYVVHCYPGYKEENGMCVKEEIEKTCEDFGYMSTPPVCPTGSTPETINVNGLTCYTGKCIQIEVPTKTCEDYGYTSYPPECPPGSVPKVVKIDDLTCYDGCEREVKPTEFLSIIIWIAIFGLIGYFIYRWVKK